LASENKEGIGGMEHQEKKPSDELRMLQRLNEALKEIEVGPVG
jgi:hypothetical protein